MVALRLLEPKCKLYFMAKNPRSNLSGDFIVKLNFIIHFALPKYILQLYQVSVRGLFRDNIRAGV